MQNGSIGIYAQQILIGPIPFKILFTRSNNSLRPVNERLIILLVMSQSGIGTSQTGVGSTVDINLCLMLKVKVPFSALSKCETQLLQSRL